MSKLDDIRNQGPSTAPTRNLSMLDRLRTEKSFEENQALKADTYRSGKDFGMVETAADETSLPLATPQQRDENAQYAGLMKQAYESNPDVFTDKHPSMLDRLRQATDPSQAWEGLKKFTSGAVDDLVNAPKTLNYPFAKTAEYAVPDAPLIGRRPDGSYGNLEGTNARQAFIQANPVAPTGDPIWDKASDVIGQFAGPLVGTMGTGIGTIPALTENALTRAGVTFGKGLGDRIGKGIVEGALTGAPLNVAATLASRDPSMTDLARSANEGIFFGGALGGAGGALGAGLSRLMKKAPEQPYMRPFAAEKAPEPAAPLSQEVPKQQAVPEVAPAAETPTTKGNWFTNLFGESKGVGITPFGSEKSTRMVSTDQQIVKNPLKKSAKGLWELAKQGAKTSYQDAVDYLSPLKNINRETYDTAMDASRANNIANTIIRDKFVDNEGNVIGQSLDDIMKKTRGLGKTVDDYLVLRHAVTRMSRGERVYDEALNMTPEKAQEAVQRLEARHPVLKEIGQAWDTFNTNILDSGVREGLISQEARDAMRQQNPNYASMRRQFSLGEKLAQPKWSSGSAFSGQKAPIQKVSPTGSTRKIVSPLRSAIEQVYAFKNAEMRNRTMQEIVKAIQGDPEGMRGIAEIVKKPSTSYKSLDEALREGGSDEFIQQLDNDFKTLFQPAKTGEENIVRSMVNGVPVFVKVHDPESVKALLGMGMEHSGIILTAMRKLSNATKRGATGVLAPMFAVKNLAADTVQAAIQSPNAVQHVLVDLPHAILSSIGDIFRIPGMKNLAEDFRRAGGEYSGLLRGDRAVNGSLYNLRREAPLSPQGLVKGAYLAVKSPFKALEKVADVTENANRMAAYRRSMVGQEKSPETVRNAISAARESTVNFSRRGNIARETETFVPYTNAAMQSIYRFAKNFSNPKTAVKTLAGMGTLVVAPKLYEFAKFNNDPDYQKLPPRERYRNLIISKNEDGTFNKVPMPPEYEAIGAFMTDVLNDVINQKPQAYKGSLDAVVNAFTPPLVSGAAQGLTQGGGLEQSITGAANATVAAPVAAVASNQSFTGAPIVPKRLQDNSTEFQYDEKTSGIGKWVGEKTGLAPLKVDYLLRAYGGDPARLLLPLSSPSGGGTPKNTLLKNFIVDPEFTNTLSNDFYSAKDAFTKAKNDNKDFNKPLPSWYSEDMEKLVNSQSKGSINKQLSDLNAQKRDINGNQLVSSEEKARRLRDIQKQMNQLYLEANAKLNSAGVPFPNR